MRQLQQPLSVFLIFILSLFTCTVITDNGIAAGKAFAQNDRAATLYQDWQTPDRLRQADTSYSIIVLTAKTEVPDLTGRTPDEAEQILRKSGLVLGNRSYRESRTPPGIIIEQYPHEKTKVELQSPISIVIAQRPHFVVPCVIDKSLKTALKILEKHGFEIGTITYRPSDRPPEIVIFQSPRCNDRITEKIPVNLTLTEPHKMGAPGNNFRWPDWTIPVGGAALLFTALLFYGVRLKHSLSNRHRTETRSTSPSLEVTIRHDNGIQNISEGAVPDSANAVRVRIIRDEGSQGLKTVKNLLVRRK
ncbi:MAG: PASTA domain-containing protein [Chlorobiales bacterium]|nr:PASTA domain-containing protein [Chlorobiales bacterium]